MRYLLEVAYKGTRFSGLQVQRNASSIQGEIDKALAVLLKAPVSSTCSSRTDAGVHARQNFLHFDTPLQLSGHFLYQMNAILCPDIAVRGLYRISESLHARFSALSRSYRYTLYTAKDPFLREYGYHYPYPVDFAALEEAAALLETHRDFSAFSKRNTQVRTFECRISEARWERQDDHYAFCITANRFLRGMVRGLTGTMLAVGRGKYALQDFRDILDGGDNRRTDFSVPAQGLVLLQVSYPPAMLSDPVQG